MKRLDPLDAECPKCGSEFHEPCHQVTRLGFIYLDGLSRKPHAARVRLAEKKEKEESRG
jgi:hypothetical protein